jgi:uncharacterized membrane protein
MNYVWGLIERWPYLLAALFAAGIVHIATTLIMPHLTSGDAYSRLSQSLPANTFVILPPARPGTQVLPFQAPDVRYAICRFDTTSGPVVLSATLPEVGWTLSLYSSEGESIYALPAASSRSIDIRLVVMPPADRFVGVVPESRAADRGLTQLQSPSPGGLAVLRAPLKARFFAAQIERDLLRANCRQQPY